jgi:hypothetical protein
MYSVSFCVHCQFSFFVPNRVKFMLLSFLKVVYLIHFLCVVMLLIFFCWFCYIFHVYLFLIPYYFMCFFSFMVILLFFIFPSSFYLPLFSCFPHFFYCNFAFLIIQFVFNVSMLDLCFLKYSSNFHVHLYFCVRIRQSDIFRELNTVICNASTSLLLYLNTCLVLFCCRIGANTAREMTECHWDCCFSDDGWCSGFNFT